MNNNFGIQEDDSFYAVSQEEMNEVQKDLNIEIPSDLQMFYSKIGYGFLGKSETNINRIMDPMSVRDFRLKQNDFEFYPDIEIYEEFEKDKMIFFEANESSLISIGFGSDNENKIYYYNILIASTLSEFLNKMRDNEEYYLDLI